MPFYIVVVFTNSPGSDLKQCAALNIVKVSKIIPPQKCAPPNCKDTCHGMGEGAIWPPTISAGSNLLAVVIKVGRWAEK